MDKVSRVLPGVVLSADHSDSRHGVTELMMASFHGNVARVRQLMEANPSSLSVKNSNGVIALEYAVSGEQMKVIDVMLGLRMNVEALDYNGQSILHRCVKANMLEKVQFCAEVGLNLDLYNRNGETALMLAAQQGNEEIVKYLLQKGCDVTLKSKDGYSALECAFMGNHLGIQMMIEERAQRESSLNSSDGQMVMFAIGSMDPEQLEALLSQHGEGLVRFRDDNGSTPLVIACGYGLVEHAKVLRRYGAEVDESVIDGDTALIQAAIHNRVDAVEWLISEGALLNRKNMLGRSALHCTAIEGHFEVVKKLVERGILINALSNNLSAALHIAVEKGFQDIIRYLLEKGAYPDPVNENRNTPLGVAILKNDTLTVELLLQFRPNVNMPQLQSYSPLMLAINRRNLNIVKLLVEHDCDLTYEAMDGASALAMARNNGEIVAYLTQAFEDRGISVVSRRVSRRALEGPQLTDNLQDAFFSICKTGYGTFDDLEGVIQQGIDINMKDAQGMTPLVAAIIHQQEVFANWLIQIGADVNITDSLGMSSLMYAASTGQLQVVNVLMDAGADISLKDRENRDAVDFAETAGHLDVVSFLQSVKNGKEKEKQVELFQALRVSDFSKAINLVVNNKLVNCQDESGNDALSYCISSRADDSLELAVVLCSSGVDFEHQDFNGRTALEQCLVHQRSDIAKQVLKHGAQLEPHLPSILIDACLNDDIDMVKTLIENVRRSMPGEAEHHISTLTQFAISNEIYELFVPTQAEDRIEEARNDTEGVNIQWWNASNTDASDDSTGLAQFSQFSKLLLDVNYSYVSSLFEMFSTIMRPNIQKQFVLFALELGKFEVAAILNIDVAIIDSTQTLPREIESTLSKPDQAEISCSVSRLASSVARIWSLLHASMATALSRGPCEDVRGIEYCGRDSKVYIYATPEKLQRVHELKDEIMPTIPHCELLDINVQPQTSQPQSTVNTGKMTMRSQHIHPMLGITHYSTGSETTGVSSMGLLLKGSQDYVYGITSSQCFEDNKAIDNKERTLSIILTNGQWRSEQECTCRVIKGDSIDLQATSQDLDIIQSDTEENDVSNSLTVAEIHSPNTHEPESNPPSLVIDTLHEKDYFKAETYDSYEKGMKSVDKSAELSKPEVDKKAKGYLSQHTGCRVISSVKMAVIQLYLKVDGGLAEYMRLNHSVYSGESHKMLGRRVYKTGIGSGCTEGIIISTNVSFQSSPGSLCHGGFVVTSVDPCVEFSRSGDSGAAVVDVESGLVFGLVEAVQRSYFCHVREKLYDHVTFCLPLYPALKYHSNKTGIHLGQFRTL